jgi:hypothetical protein
MNCGKCNQPLAADAQFCGNCGTPVLSAQVTTPVLTETSPVVTEQSAQPNVPAPVVATTVPQSPVLASAAPVTNPPVAIQPQPGVAAAVAVAPVVAVMKPIFFRRYWWFAAIFLLLTPIIGLAIIFTGEIYKKSKATHEYEPISNKEKTTLTIVLVLLTLLAYGSRV